MCLWCMCDACLSFACFGVFRGGRRRRYAILEEYGVDGRAEVFAADGREDKAVCAWMRNALKATRIQYAKSKRKRKYDKGTTLKFSHLHMFRHMFAHPNENIESELSLL